MANIRIRVGDDVLAVPPKSSITEIFGRVDVERKRIIAALLNNHLVSLNTQLSGDAVVRPVVLGEEEAEPVQRRTACLALHAVAQERFPDLTLHIGQSLDRSCFYEVRGYEGDLAELAGSLGEALAALAAARVQVVQRAITVEAAEKLFRSGNKCSLLRTWASPTVSLVELGGFVDIGHGPYAPHTGYVEGCRVQVYASGVVLRFPGSSETIDQERGRSLYRTYIETRDWNRRLGVATIGQLNQAVLEDRMDDVLRVAEALHEKKIAALAETIGARPELRVISVAGPSSAGKTTFVRRLSIQLRVLGIEPVCISLDDYYRDRSECPRDETGEYDFEALEALKLELIDEHLLALLAGVPIRVPRFEFQLGTAAPETSWRRVELGPRQVALIEGIHGLNPRLTGKVPPDALFRIFVDGLTQLVIDEHNRLNTADCRLLRRLVRDRRYRATSAADTIMRWPSVQRGACRHIFPFQDRADAVFNSALVYETAVLKTFAWRYLLEVPRRHPARVTAYRLLKLLELFVPVFPDGVPANSVLREFIGGSGFSY